MKKNSWDSVENEFLKVKSKKNTYLDFSYSEEKSMEIKSYREANFIVRNVRKMNEGSLRNSVQSFVGICMGPVILSFPYLFKELGIVFSFLFLFINYLVASISYKLYIELIFFHKCKNLIQLFKISFGNIFSKIGLFSIIVLIIVKISIFFIIGFDLFFNIWEKFSVINLKGLGKYELLKYRSIYFIINFFSVMFLFMKKDISKFRYFNLFFIIISLYIIILVFIQSFSFYSEILLKKIIYLPKVINRSFFLNMSSTLLGYFSHSVIINIWAVTQNPTKKRCSKIKNYSLTILALAFTFFGLTGYLSFLDNTNEIVVNRMNKNSVTKDIFMTIGIVLYILGNQVILSLYGPSLTKYINLLFGFNNIKEIYRKIIISVTYFFSILISIFIKDIHELFGICGAILCNFIGYIFPIIYFIITFRNQMSIIHMLLLFIILIYLISIPICLFILN